MKNLKLITFIAIISLITLSYLFFRQNNNNQYIENSSYLKSIKNKKVLYVNSYHSGYEWSDEIENGILKIFQIKKNADNSLNLTDSLVIFKRVEMNTKINTEESFKKQAALKIKHLIENWNPDVVIVSDDNAVKYLVKPYFNNSSLPIVFCGVNWSIDKYKLATNNNITGLIEISHFEQLFAFFKKYVPIIKIGFINFNTSSAQAEVNRLEKYKQFKTTAYLVNSFSQWTKAIKKLDSEVDLIMVDNNAGFSDWNSKKAMDIVAKLSTPTGTVNDWMIPYNMVSFGKSANEHGQWAATASISILKGKSPKDIPVETAKKAVISINMNLINKFDYKIPIDFLESANIINNHKKRLLYVNSYHKGYIWSDNIEKGLLKALKIKENSEGAFDNINSAVEIKVVYMNTKINKSINFKKEAALKVKSIIDSWNPDIVVTSDDNAAKYLIAPYYKNSKIPFVFCGLNGEASSYGFPTKNITGMIEVGYYIETINMLKKYAKGDRLALIGADTLTFHKDIHYLVDINKIKFSKIKIIKTFTEFKTKYIELQNSVDMILWFSPIGIKNWDKRSAIDFIYKHTKIPTGTASEVNINYALLGRVYIAEEQGYWSGKTALKILAGKKPIEIPIIKNRQSRLFLNMTLARKIGVKFPLRWLNSATLIGK